MSLERVIAEQQAKIDQLTALVDNQNKSLATMWSKHEALFENVACLTEADLPPFTDKEMHRSYFRLVREIRLQLMECGFCPRCHGFNCECGDDYE